MDILTNMKINCLVLFLFLFDACVSHASSINQFSIKVVEPTYTYAGSMLCKGSMEDAHAFAEAGISLAQLKEGIDCVTADFDGNGYLDFVLYGSKRMEIVRWYDEVSKINREKKVSVGRNLLILFTHKKNIMKFQVIKNASEVDVFGVKDKRRKDYPKVDQSLPGLIHYAEGDLGHVYFFNRKSGLLEESKYIYPPNYD